MSANSAVVCERCEYSFALNMVALGKLPLDDLPDPFPAKCPSCDHTGSYLKSSVKPVQSKS
jgi:hypothetical protein